MTSLEWQQVLWLKSKGKQKHFNLYYAQIMSHWSSIVVECYGNWNFIVVECSSDGILQLIKRVLKRKSKMKNGAGESSSGNEKNSQLFFLEEGQNWQTLTLHTINLAHTNHKQWQQVSICYGLFWWIFCCTNANSTNYPKSSFLFFNLRLKCSWNKGLVKICQ